MERMGNVEVIREQSRFIHKNLKKRKAVAATRLYLLLLETLSPVGEVNK